MFNKILLINGYMYSVDYCDECKKCCKWALETAIKKLPYTMDLWRNKRTKLDTFIDLFYGDLAKNLVKLFLTTNTSKKIDEYDLLRNDNFRDHDKYDLMINGNTIEVKSSLEKYSTDIKVIYNERRIIVNIYDQQTISDYVVQVFYVPQNLQYFKFKRNCDSNISEEELLKIGFQECDLLYSNKIKTYICGWINKKQEKRIIEKAIHESQAFKITKYNNKAYRKTYGNIHICDSNKLDDLIEEFKKFNS